MSSLSTSLHQLNQNSLVGAADLAAARERWNNRNNEMRLQQPSDALFIMIYAQIQTLIDSFTKAIFDKIPTAATVYDLEVPLWSFQAHMGKKPVADAVSYELGLDWYVSTRYENGKDSMSAVRVIEIIQHTDILLRLSALFGSDFSVFYRPLLGQDSMYELVLRYSPDGRPEEQKAELAKIWTKYGRLGIMDKLHHLPRDEIYVLHRSSVLGELTVRAPPSSSSRKSQRDASNADSQVRKRSMSSDETQSSHEEAKRPHYGCYCQYSF
jgi:hypothetical protein